MKVTSMMSSPVHTVQTTAAVSDAVRKMVDHRVSALPVVDDDRKVVGLLTTAELIPQVRNAPASNTPLMSLCDEYVDYASLDTAYREFAHVQVSQIMRHKVVSVGPDVVIGAVARLMMEHHVGAVPVVGDDGSLIGIITRTDIARLSIEQDRL